MKKRWSLKEILFMVVVTLCIFTNGALQQTNAAQMPQEIGNLVIFVKYADDTRDIYNAVYDTGSMIRKNWDMIKNMYNANIEHDYIENVDYDNSFKNYISVITEGNVNVINYFPQETADGTGVMTYTLQNTAANYTSDGQIISEVLVALDNGTIATDSLTAAKLSHIQEGYVDNLTIVVQGTSTGASDIIHPHRAQYGGQETFLGLHTYNYIIMPSNTLVTDDANIGMSGQQEQGVIAHEFLHVLGFPDLYRYGDDGVPVGVWDVMASNSRFLQYPLSYVRAQQGWIDLNWIESNAPGTYTLTAVSESGGNKVYAIKTPLSDSEYIVLEYRRKAESISAFESKIPSSGLLMYRVDDKIENHTNAAGKNYIYVYRPDVTDPEAGKDIISGTAMSTVYNAAIDVENGETGYGSTDLSKSYTENTLYYSDGQNSGIKISNVQLSGDKKQLTFTIDFADYTSADIWDNMGAGLGVNMVGNPVLYSDSSNGDLYMAYTEQSAAAYQVVVNKWSGSSWVQVGSSISNAKEPKLAVCAGEVYLSYQNAGNWHPVYCKLGETNWVTIMEQSVSSAKNMQFIEDAANLYASYIENTADGNNRLVILDIKKNKLITNSKVVQEFGNPSICKVGSLFYVAYSDFFGGNGNNTGKIEIYDTGTKTWSVVHQYGISTTNCHLIKEVNGKIYAFVGANGVNPIVSVYDGAQWTDTSISQMSQYLEVSMDIVGDEIYISYIDTVKKKASILRKDGNTFTEYYDNLGTGTVAFSTCSYENQIYAVTKAENANSAYVRKKGVTLPQYTLTVTPPTGYNNANIYIDGIPYNAVKRGNDYTIILSHTNARTATMYLYDTNGIPRGMYVWSLSYSGGQYSTVPLAGLQDLISYHGFSIRVQDPAGIRFKSGINQNLRSQLLGSGVDGYRLVEYGTLMMTNSNRNSYPFVKLGRKTAGGRSYWMEGTIVNDKIFETTAGRIRFASVLTGLPSSQYNTDFAFRGYIILEKNGEKIVLYGPAVYRSVYRVAKQIEASGEFQPGSSGYNYIKGIISSVEGN